MKYLLFALILFTSCEKTRCYEFVYSHLITVKPARANYPQRRNAKQTLCNLSQKEAELKAAYRFDTTWVNGTDTFTDHVTTTYTKQ